MSIYRFQVSRYIELQNCRLTTEILCERVHIQTEKYDKQYLFLRTFLTVPENLILRPHSISFLGDRRSAALTM
jgi:hypothetical protein